MRICLFIVALAGLNWHTLAQGPDTTEVVEIEYFFDVDPGFGNATSIVVSPDSVASISQALISNGLANGFHVLFMRARNLGAVQTYNTLDTGVLLLEPDLFIDPSLNSSGQWGITESRLVFVDPSSSAEVQLIDTIEYFFDVDPGTGQGVIIDDFALDSVVSIGRSLQSNGLSTGFHVLFMRAKAQGGSWGLPDSRLVYVDPSTSAEVQLIDTIEYYFDLDPGVGQGFIIDSFGLDSIVSIEETLQSNGLATGFHVLFMRAKAQGGSWGLSESRLVYVDPSSSGEVQLIDTIEYYFDLDPGVGQGFIIDSFGLDSIVSIEETLQSNGLVTGFHVLFMRAKAQGGSWGLSESRLVYVDPSSSGEVQLIDTIEYYFDLDPGVGQGFVIDGFGLDSIVSIEETLQSNGLVTGFHVLFMRAKAQGGSWGLSESRLVYVDPSSSGEVQLIDTIEYYFDLDPGVGLGNIIADFSTDSIVGIDRILTSNGLAPGFHVLFMRAKAQGGSWGLSESRLVYVDPAGAGDIIEIDQLEYFFDIDPGVGSATTIAVAQMNSINVTETLSTSGLPNGFHSLYLRARAAGGSWGASESRLIYVDQAGNTISEIDELEYFVDDDPGFGNGTSIPITPGLSIDLVYDIAADSIPVGNHIITLRARNTDGEWSLGETRVYNSLEGSRERDSLSLKVTYEQLIGAEWNNNENWLTGSLDTWYGVDVVDDRVDTVRLEANNLSGTMPKELGYLNIVKELDLSHNDLLDTVPDSFIDMDFIETLDFANNQLNYLPDISFIDSLRTVHLDSNRFQFGPLEPYSGLPTFTYSGQALVSAPLDSVINIGAAFDLGFNITGENNVYQWYRDSVLLNGVINDTIQFVIQPPDTGTYQLRITNPLLPGLMLSTDQLRFSLSPIENDSVVLLNLYETLSGNEWINVENWLIAPVDQWEGVTVDSGRVNQLNLSGKGLVGQLPQRTYFMSEIRSLDFSNNQLADSVPEDFLRFSKLEAINLASNLLEKIPQFALLDTIQVLIVGDNRLQFDDLEPNISIDSFTYVPQALITEHVDTLHALGFPITFEILVPGDSNNYQWNKNGEPIEGQMANAFTIEDPQFTDEGVFTLAATSNIVQGLTLTSGDFLLKISSLERDRLVLLEFYQATNGENWNPQVDWTTNEDVTTWDGVTADTRVTELDLPSRNIQGEVPTSFTDIESLISVDLSDNEITRIPRLTRLGEITSFDARANRLDYLSLDPNINVAGFEYTDQAFFGEPLDVIIDQGTDQQLNISVGGENNLYQWYLNNVQINDATNKDYLVDSINYEDMGNYQARVTSPAVSAVNPDFFLRNFNQRVRAKADIEFIPIYEDINGNNAQLDEGFANLIRIKSGAYDTVETAKNIPITSEKILIQDQILGNYLFGIKTDSLILKDVDGVVDSVKLLPTYYISTSFWEEADVLKLRTFINDTLFMQQRPRPLPPRPDGGEIGMLVETDFDEEDGGRMEARRRVQRAGCSLSRRRGSGRSEDNHDWELYIYKETDDNGRVQFENLEPNTYRLNIQYPGIPMDSTSFIEFLVGEEGEESNTLELEATVTEEGIFVELIEALGFYRSYFNDLTIYPNPTVDLIKISYHKLMKEGVVMRITDMQGRIFKEVPVEKGFNKSMEVDVTELQKNIYMINFFDPKMGGQSISTFKVVIKD